jgi:hypothetical protein
MTTVSEERRNRIKLSVAAYAYEMDSNSIMSDGDFDSLCLKINVDIDTGNTLLDTFFRDEFNPSTGQWIHKHPELGGIRNIYEKYYKNCV